MMRRVSYLLLQSTGLLSLAVVLTVVSAVLADSGDPSNCCGTRMADCTGCVQYAIVNGNSEYVDVPDNYYYKCASYTDVTYLCTNSLDKCIDTQGKSTLQAYSAIVNGKCANPITNKKVAVKKELLMCKTPPASACPPPPPPAPPDDEG